MFVNNDDTHEDYFDYTFQDMSAIKSAAKFVVLMVVGLVTIVVGSFMLRGIMHLWDRQRKPDDDN